MAKKPQLHEALAVRPSLQNQSKKVLSGETQNFKSKQHIFEGSVETFKPVAEGQNDVQEKETILTATVTENLDYGLKSWIKSIECEHQVEKGNQSANSDVICDGITIFKDAPATFLLVLSKRLQEIRTLLDTIPTMDMKLGFEIDSTYGKPDVFKSVPITRKRTKKVEDVKVVVQATPEFPAQTHLFVKDEETGTLETIHYAGKMTPSEKAARIDRVDRLIRAVDKARSTANRTEIETKSVAKTLFRFLSETPTDDADQELSEATASITEG